MKPPLTRKTSYSFKRHSVRTDILKFLQSRRMLIFICSLVVLECMCVTAELMVDLHGIRVRFENEEKQIQKFLTFMRAKQPEFYKQLDGRTLAEVLQILQKTTRLWEPDQSGKCDCTHSKINSSRPNEFRKGMRRKRTARPLLRDGRQVADLKRDLHTDEYRGLDNNIRIERSVSDDELLRYKTAEGKKQKHINIKQKEYNPGYIDTNRKTLLTIIHDTETGTETNDNESIKKLGLHTWLSQNNLSFGVRIEKTEINDKESNNNRKNLYNLLTEGSMQNPRTDQKHDNSVTSNTDVYKEVVNIPNISKGVREANRRSSSRPVRPKRSLHMTHPPVPEVFIFSVNTDVENYYLVTESRPLNDRNISGAVELDIEAFQNEYKKYNNASNILTFVGFAIFSLMILEILVKLACTGLRFFKKKIDVFDAIIVAVSFALDATFLDSKWYETGKGATTVLVLLLPWRVVRIVNSFLMTINHKHHIEIMTIRRAKKKCELKISKLKELVMELRRDVDLLVNLCKLKGATAPEIATCIYGKGRCTATLAAITSFTSLMFISTLGKRDPREDDVSDDLYGNIIRDILEDDIDEEEAVADKQIKSKDDDDMEDELQHDEIYTVTQSLRRSGSRQKSESKFSSQRRATIPRRHVSCSEEDDTCSYVNDGYVMCDVTCDELNPDANRSQSKKIVKSLPSLKKEASEASPCSNFLRFEVRTQVSYL